MGDSRSEDGWLGSATGWPAATAGWHNGGAVVDVIDRIRVEVVELDCESLVDMSSDPADQQDGSVPTRGDLILWPFGELSAERAENQSYPPIESAPAAGRSQREQSETEKSGRRNRSSSSQSGGGRARALQIVHGFVSDE